MLRYLIYELIIHINYFLFFLQKEMFTSGYLDLKSKDK